MHLEVTPLFDKGRRLSKDELKHVVPVRGDVTIGAVSWNGRTVYEATVLEGKNHLLPRLIEPTVTGVATIAMHVEGFEPVKTALGWVYYRQCWLCREHNR
jgi:hypothetical protein